MPAALLPILVLGALYVLARALLPSQTPPDRVWFAVQSGSERNAPGELHSWHNEYLAHKPLGPLVGDGYLVHAEKIVDYGALEVDSELLIVVPTREPDEFEKLGILLHFEDRLGWSYRATGEESDGWREYERVGLTDRLYIF